MRHSRFTRGYSHETSYSDAIRLQHQSAHRRTHHGLCNTSASAVPTLQLYGPGSTYDTTTESWLTYDNPSELWVVGAQSPSKLIRVDQPTLLIAVPDDCWDPFVSLTLKTITDHPLDNNPLALSEIVLTKDNLTSGDAAGSPEDFGLYGGKKFPPHDVYPARFWAVDLSSFLYPDSMPSFLDVAGAGETVADYNPGASGSTAGDIQYYEISYEPYGGDLKFSVDLIGYAGKWEWVKAPFSHNLEAESPEPVVPIPEPSVMTLLVMGTTALSLRVVRRKRRGRASAKARA